MDNIKPRISKAGKKFFIVSITDTKQTVDVLFSKYLLEPDEEDKKKQNNFYSKNKKKVDPIKVKNALESGVPIVISCDAKVSPDRVSLFGKDAEILSLNTQLNGTLYITVKDENAVIALKKALDTIGPGYTNIEFNIIIDNKKVIIPLRDKYNITTENLERIKSINHIEFTF